MSEQERAYTRPWEIVLRTFRFADYFLYSFHYFVS